MKVVVVVDSFKGSMTSMEAGMAVKEGILAAKKDAEVVVKPLADGGEGTTDALIEGLKGERVDVTVTVLIMSRFKHIMDISGKVIPQLWKWQQQQVSHFQIRRIL